MYGTSSVRTGLLKPTRLHKSHNRLLARILLKESIHHYALCGNIWYFFFLHFCKVTLRIQFKTLILKTKWYDFLYTPLSLPPLSSSTLGTDRTELWLEKMGRQRLTPTADLRSVCGGNTCALLQETDPEPAVEPEVQHCSNDTHFEIKINKWTNRWRKINEQMK